MLVYVYIVFLCVLLWILYISDVVFECEVVRFLEVSKLLFLYVVDTVLEGYYIVLWLESFFVKVYFVS